MIFEGPDYHIAADHLNHRITCWGYRLAEASRPGRFDIDAARKLGVPSGPLFGRLQRGECVVLDDGTQVNPDQVLGPGRSGRSIAYCCDTSPCDGAIRLSAGADMVIHEGTYAPHESKIAHQRGHSTMADAARLAKTAGARELVITHISPKYIRTDAFLPPVRKIFPHTKIARDLDTFKVPLSEN